MRRAWWAEMILDCDLVVGRDISTGRRLDSDGLRATMATAGIGGGLVSSWRALTYDVVSGNDQARVAAAELDGWLAAGIDLRDPLGAEKEIDRTARWGGRVVRLAPQRQGVPVQAPGLRECARRAVQRDMLLAVEGDFRTYGPGLAGLGANVLFLDLHFYQVGDFVVLGRDEPGFHASTRLLGNPDSWEIVVSELGPERLVLGSRPGWGESDSVLGRLRHSDLDRHTRDLVGAGNLRRLVGETS